MLHIVLDASNFFFSRIGYAAVEAMTSLKLVERGVPTIKINIIVVILNIIIVVIAINIIKIIVNIIVIIRGVPKAKIALLEIPMIPVKIILTLFLTRFFCKIINSIIGVTLSTSSLTLLAP